MLRALRDGIVPYWQIARLLPAVSRPLTVVVATGVVIGAALPVAATVVTGTLVGSIPAAVAAGAGSAAARQAFGALAVVGALFVVGRAFGIVRGTLTTVLGRRLDEHLRERVMQPHGRILPTAADRAARGSSSARTSAATAVGVGVRGGTYLPRPGPDDAPRHRSAAPPLPCAVRLRRPILSP